MGTTLLKLRIYGDHCLRKKSDSVQEVGPSERLLIKTMLEVMYSNNGVGLAAPQVGINRRIFVIDVGDGPLAMINPKVLKGKGAEMLEEGCLSLPGVVVNVKRPQNIVVEYINPDNQSVNKELSGLLARVFLHESDHLNGKLISDYAGFCKKVQLRKSLKGISKKSQPIL